MDSCGLSADLSKDESSESSRREREWRRQCKWESFFFLSEKRLNVATTLIASAHWHWASLLVIRYLFRFRFVFSNFLSVNCSLMWKIVFVVKDHKIYALFYFITFRHFHRSTTTPLVNDGDDEVDEREKQIGGRRRREKWAGTDSIAQAKLRPMIELDVGEPVFFLRSRLASLRLLFRVVFVHAFLSYWAVLLTTWWFQFVKCQRRVANFHNFSLRVIVVMWSSWGREVHSIFFCFISQFFSLFEFREEKVKKLKWIVLKCAELQIKYKNCIAKKSEKKKLRNRKSCNFQCHRKIWEKYKVAKKKEKSTQKYKIKKFKLQKLWVKSWISDFSTIWLRNFTDSKCSRGFQVTVWFLFLFMKNCICDGTARDIKQIIHQQNVAHIMHPRRWLMLCELKLLFPNFSSRSMCSLTSYLENSNSSPSIQNTL